MDALTAFKSRVDAFLALAGMSASRFGTLACGDSAFVIDLKAGREPRFSTIAKVDKFMLDWKAEHMPERLVSLDTNDTSVAPQGVA